MTVKYFGDCNCDPSEKIPTPVGEKCLYCEEEIDTGDSGVSLPYINTIGCSTRCLHIECFIRGTIGSFGHITKQCSCYGGNLEDPPNVSKREAAKMALMAFKMQQQTSKN